MGNARCIGYGVLSGDPPNQGHNWHTLCSKNLTNLQNVLKSSKIGISHGATNSVSNYQEPCRNLNMSKASPTTALRLWAQRSVGRRDIKLRSYSEILIEGHTSSSRKPLAGSNL